MCKDSVTIRSVATVAITAATPLLLLPPLALLLPALLPTLLLLLLGLRAAPLTAAYL